jgi:hypothetical protein
MGGRFLTLAASDVTVDGASHAPWKFRIVGIRSDNGMVYVGSGSNNATFRNLEMDGASESGGEDGFRIDTVDGLTIEHCYIHDYRYLGGSHIDALQMPSGTNFTYRYNISKNNGMHVFLGDVAWYGSNLGWVDNIKIYNNVFYNGNIGGQSYSTIDCKNCNRSGSYYMYMDNNTFDVGSRPILEYKNGSNTSQLYFRNNIVYNSTAGSAHDGKYSYNAYYSGNGPSQTGLYNGDPQFTNRAGGDYSLKSTSPVKDRGADVGYTVDIAGVALPSGEGYPIGAYEVNNGGGGAVALAAPQNLRVSQ